MAIIGAIIGMLIAGIVAIVYASESSTLVRYLIMSAGFLLGLGAGKLAAGKS
ncbi:MAG: hypothetical protein ABI617_07120 [Sphingomicrobium sp.]